MYRIIGADGRDYGPVGVDELRQWIREGRANAQSQVQTESNAEWRPLGTFSEFAADLGASGSRSPSPLPAISIGSNSSSTTNGLAVAGFILGLLSLVGFCCCCLSLPCSTLGLIFSCMGLSQISQNSMQGGRGIAIAGIVLSSLGLLLVAASMMFGTFSATINP